MKTIHAVCAAAALLLVSGCAYRTPAAPLLGALGGAGVGAVIGNQANGGHDQELWALGGSVLGLAAGTGVYLTQDQEARRFDHRNAYRPPPPAPAPVYSPPPYYYGPPPAYTSPPYNYYNGNSYNGYGY